MNEFAVSLDDALARLHIIPDYDCGNGPEPCVHTFRVAGLMRTGGHWPLHQVRAAMEQHGVAESGPSATAMQHGLVFVDESGPVFLETR